jgi:hypothetical protein
MKTLFSLPKDDGFFNRYATLIPTLRKLGILSQVINAITEVGIMYAVVYSLLSEFWGAYAVPLSIFGAMIGTGVIELGLRQFLPYACRAVLFKRFKGLDLWMSLFILISCLALFACSLTMSFRGSKAMVEAAAPTPEQKSTAAADVALNTGKLDATQTFSRDSGEIAARYAGLITTQKNAYGARIETERATVAKYQRTGQSYTTLINAAKAKINNLQAERAGKIADLEAQKAKEIQDAAARKNADFERLTTAHTFATTDIQTQNSAARQKAESRTRTYGSGLAWFTLIFHFVLILAVALDEMNNKGSGIEQVAQPNQYHFSESIWASFWNTVSDKWNFHARTKIKKWADRTPAPPRPSAPPTLYELADWKPQRVTLETQPADFAGMATGATGTSAKEDTDRGLGVLSFAAMRFNAKRYQPTADENPGITQSGPGVLEVDKSLKPCLQCGTMFRYRTTWQKFCTDDCKLAHHEQKHGRKFDPRQYRQNRK